MSTKCYLCHESVPQELFDSASATFTASTSMNSIRTRHTVTPLLDGKVLLAGGSDTGFDDATNTAEIFDPLQSTFTFVGPMAVARNGHTATLLQNGKVLLAGGYSLTVNGITPGNTAELFDPATRTFTSVSPMNLARYAHTATLLASGKVLIAGGYYPTSTGGTLFSNTAELFDPTTGTFTPVAPMNFVRVIHTATRLRDGTVLITGGTGQLDGAAAEIFDPASETFFLVSPMNVARYEGHAATLLPNGQVLITGGYVMSPQPTDTAEVYDPDSGIFIPIGPMTAGRSYHSATLLSSGMVLIAGGYLITGEDATQSAELFDPATGQFISLGATAMTSRRVYHSAVLLPSGKVLIAGGQSVRGVPMMLALNTTEIFDSGLGFSDDRRPIITGISTSIPPTSVLVTGSGFRGDSEAAGGSYNNSATDYPLLQLTRIDNEQSFFVRSDPATNWSDTSFTSETFGAPLPVGSYRLTVFTNAIPSLQKLISITNPTPVQLVSAVSRKIHGDTGTFDVDLPLTGNPGIECRSPGANNSHQLVFTFDGNLQNAGSAAITQGTADPSPATVQGPETNQVTVNLTGVNNAQHLIVTLSNVRDSVGNVMAPVAARMDVLLGDVNASGNVDAADVGQVQRQNNKPLTSTAPANFRMDVNVSGNIDAADVGQVQRQNSKHL